MSLNVYLFMKANGTEIEGESTVVSMGREKAIECFAYKDRVTTRRETRSGLATGRRSYEPITVRKRLDKSTPLLLKALANNELIEAEIKFYRPSLTGDGSTEHYMTVEVKEGRISEIHREIADTLDPAYAQYPAFEEVSITFNTIEVRFEESGVAHQDNWTTQEQ